MSILKIILALAVWGLAYSLLAKDTFRFAGATLDSQTNKLILAKG
jgi:hypothetical protein